MALIRVVISVMRVLASSQAAPRPTMAGTFSVPERSPFSCPPPKMSGLSNNRLSIISAADPLGP